MACAIIGVSILSDSRSLASPSHPRSQESVETPRIETNARVEFPPLSSAPRDPFCSGKARRVLSSLPVLAVLLALRALLVLPVLHVMSSMAFLPFLSCLAFLSIPPDFLARCKERDDESFVAVKVCCALPFPFPFPFLSLPFLSSCLPVCPSVSLYVSLPLCLSPRLPVSCFARAGPNCPVSLSTASSRPYLPNWAALSEVSTSGKFRRILPNWEIFVFSLSKKSLILSLYIPLTFRVI